MGFSGRAERIARTVLVLLPIRKCVVPRTYAILAFYPLLVHLIQHHTHDLSDFHLTFIMTVKRGNWFLDGFAILGLGEGADSTWD